MPGAKITECFYREYSHMLPVSNASNQMKVGNTLNLLQSGIKLNKLPYAKNLYEGKIHRFGHFESHLSI